MPLHLKPSGLHSFDDVDLHLTLDSSKFLSIFELLLVVVTRKLLRIGLLLLFNLLLFNLLLFVLTTLEACGVDCIFEIAFSRRVACKPIECRI